MGGVNGTANQWWVVSVTPLTKYDTSDQWASKPDKRWLLLMGISIKKKITQMKTVLHSI
jgi:hypothetical protein